jgi:hypothetical protein
MPKEPTMKALLAALKVKQDAVGKVRDDLREFADSVECLKDTCERAYDALQDAIENLSELA